MFEGSFQKKWCKIKYYQYLCNKLGIYFHKGCAMPLFSLQTNKVNQIKPISFAKERELQRLFESNLAALLGVQFVATEFSTGDRQRGRIDTLGLDQDGSPVIIEYKKSGNDNIINQGLFYLDWLVDHKGDFALAAQKVLGKDIEIDWSRPRLILIAEFFSEYDKFAANRIGANMELWTFRRYGEDLLYLDPIYVAEAPREKTKKFEKQQEKEKEETSETPMYTLEGHLRGKSKTIRSLYEELRERIFALDSEGAIIEKANKLYVVYKHGKNFCEIWIQNAQLKLWLDISLDELDDPYALAKDVANVGHWGTGDIEINLDDESQVDKVMALIAQAFQQTV
jgi:predicted transport protein